MSKKIAIITARGGSKRIPRKNIKYFFGQPMIKYAIDAARESNIFDVVMVSTDDEEIAQIATECGAALPFMRSKETANDFATTLDVLIEVVFQYKKQNIDFDTLCCIYPCVPFLKADVLAKAYNVLVKNDGDMLIPIVKYSHPIQRALCIRDKFIEYVHPQFKEIRTQDCEPMYHDVGMFYFYKVSALSIQSKKMCYYEMNESSIQDIDTEEDWNNAEVKYKILQFQKEGYFDVYRHGTLQTEFTPPIHTNRHQLTA